MYISVKYFDPAIHKMCRTFEPYEYEHWGTNIYTYETMEKIILDLENDGGWDNLVLQLKIDDETFSKLQIYRFYGEVFDEDGKFELTPNYWTL